MSVAKVIEITAESPKSFEAAIREGMERASQTVSNIQSAWIKEQKITFKNGSVDKFRVDMKVTFLLEG